MAKIDITEKQEDTIKTLFSRYLPNTKVWVYGSRINGNSNENSDLDVAVFSSDEQMACLAELREKLENNFLLPFRVDLHIWEHVPENFKANILSNHVELIV
jgi:type I restriction enzyme S subunit